MNFAPTLALALAFALVSSAGAGAEPATEHPDETSAAPSGAADDGRRKVELFWLRPSAGYSTVNLTTFQADSENLTADLIPSRLQGATFGLGAGLRLLFVSLALGGRVDLFENDDSALGNVDDMQLWSVDGDLYLHLLSGYRLEPYLKLGAGYSRFGGVGDAVRGADYRIDSWNAHAGVGLDYFVSDHVSLGALISGQLLFLARPGTSATALLEPEQVETLGQARRRLLEADGSSIGTGFSVVVGPGLHF